MTDGSAPRHEIPVLIDQVTEGFRAPGDDDALQAAAQAPGNALAVAGELSHLEDDDIANNLACAVAPDDRYQSVWNGAEAKYLVPHTEWTRNTQGTLARELVRDEFEPVRELAKYIKDLGGDPNGDDKRLAALALMALHNGAEKIVDIRRADLIRVAEREVDLVSIRTATNAFLAIQNKDWAAASPEERATLLEFFGRVLGGLGLKIVKAEE